MSSPPLDALSAAAAVDVDSKRRTAQPKTFQCRGFGDCHMVFSRAEHLARHKRKHTGERPFRCHCSKQFSRLDNLRQHAQTVHADKPGENERMMRDLTSLHASISAASRGNGARASRRSQPSTALSSSSIPSSATAAAALAAAASSTAPITALAGGPGGLSAVPAAVSPSTSISSVKLEETSQHQFQQSPHSRPGTSMGYEGEQPAHLYRPAAHPNTHLHRSPSSSSSTAAAAWASAHRPPLSRPVTANHQQPFRDEQQPKPHFFRSRGRSFLSYERTDLAPPAPPSDRPFRPSAGSSVGSSIGNGTLSNGHHQHHNHIGSNAAAASVSSRPGSSTSSADPSRSLPPLAELVGAALHRPLLPTHTLTSHAPQQQLLPLPSRRPGTAPATFGFGLGGPYGHLDASHSASSAAAAGHRLAGSGAPPPAAAAAASTGDRYRNHYSQLPVSSSGRERQQLAPVYYDSDEEGGDNDSPFLFNPPSIAEPVNGSGLASGGGTSRKRPADELDADDDYDGSESRPVSRRLSVMELLNENGPRAVDVGRGIHRIPTPPPTGISRPGTGRAIDDLLNGEPGPNGGGGSGGIFAFTSPSSTGVAPGYESRPVTTTSLVASASNLALDDRGYESGNGHGGRGEQLQRDRLFAGSGASAGSAAAAFGTEYGAQQYHHQQQQQQQYEWSDYRSRPGSARRLSASSSTSPPFSPASAAASVIGRSAGGATPPAASASAAYALSTPVSSGAGSPSPYPSSISSTSPPPSSGPGGA